MTLKRVEELTAERDALRLVVKRCADTFATYAALHAAKEPTRENVEKFERNTELAQICRHVLRGPRKC